MSIHLYTKIWANMRTCYCNGVTSDPPGPAAVARPGLGAEPGAVRPLEMQRKSRLAHQKRDFGYISGPSPTAAAASRAPVQRRRPHLEPRLNGSGRISDPGATATAVSPLKTKAPPPNISAGAHKSLCATKRSYRRLLLVIEGLELDEVLVAIHGGSLVGGEKLLGALGERGGAARSAASKPTR